MRVTGTQLAMGTLRRMEMVNLMERATVRQTTRVMAKAMVMGTEKKKGDGDGDGDGDGGSEGDGEGGGDGEGEHGNGRPSAWREEVRGCSVSEVVHFQ